MHLIIGGIDVSSYVQDGGIARGEVQRNFKSRTTLEGTKYVSKIKKLSYNIKFDPVSEEDLRGLLTTLDSDYVSVAYKDPVLGFVYKTFLPTVSSVELVLEDRHGATYWSGLVVYLEEQ